MADDVLLNKASIIERCIGRAREEYASDPRNLEENLTKQDSIVLNLQRACEAAIDLAMHVVAARRLGVPQQSRDAFRLLAEAGLVDAELAARLMRMVGFRNVAVHDYQKLSLPIVRALVERGVDDLALLASILLRLG